jgi:hypothetical protein
MPDAGEAAAFRRAAEIFGGATALSHWLKVPLDALRKWITGEERPPQLLYRQVMQLLGAQDDPARNGELHLSRTDSTPSALGLGVRVLIAHKDRDAVMTLGVLLRSEGFELRLLIGVAELARAVSEFRPHAVLLDPADVTKQLGSSTQDPAPMLIAMTKPVDSEALLSRLAALKNLQL